MHEYFTIMLLQREINEQLLVLSRSPKNQQAYVGMFTGLWQAKNNFVFYLECDGHVRQHSSGQPEYNMS